MGRQIVGQVKEVLEKYEAPPAKFSSNRNYDYLKKNCFVYIH